jgi:hypothetical protein
VTARTLHTGDGLAWLAAHAPLPADHSIITSLPDSSELPALGFEGWRAWFSDTSALICRSLAPSSAAIFFQTDVKRDGAWVDKAYLVQRGAEAAGSAQLWHKVVCRAPAGIATFGRPAYAHLLCFSRALRLEPKHSTADVLPRLGEMTWARAMGVEACVAACRFLAQHAGARTIVDPFCGLGTALAVANALGLHGVGVELSKKRAEKARHLKVHLEPGTH